ncbi:DNA gyrase/topoisomerase IV subunit B [Anaerotignum propionicum]|uniref:DNA topoisomerase (ATP-hydrolyzing) n=1 Tax=Anaerotignum propionicum DSM 1682 TaxID=991789 RepID=A0A0X8VD27_ANAPI|nr:toprim domain-containing protein [Anaerotignum propionicum]AMJ40560.1 DNA gyrase subunit B [Anaerotignum propionicum DSM 1682]MEA5057065.1 toprim domain-containing protein [Anaerotignum propionicum]SHE38887.1 DNA gyrase subunit B [[Clostridium] propionicum DSM 1682] [Anaerotignum propionicum DSM 1682]
MKSQQKSNYTNESITSLKGADRVRLRPGVIFGSDGLDGCEHAVFEILSNSIDEAREGYGNKIEVVRYKDHSIMVKDYGRGIPVDYNSKEDRFNWELVFCELYAGGKYQNNTGENYEFSLGLNGLGTCATQYASEYMDAVIYRDGICHSLHFEKGENVGGLMKEGAEKHPSGTQIKWRPDRDVFTDINIPLTYFQDILKKQAVVNAGLTFELFDEESGEKYIYCYKNGIKDYLLELSGADNLTDVHYLQTETKGRDREDKPEYKLKFEAAFCFNNQVNILEYYHNSSFLEYGGSPDKAVKNAFVFAIDKYLKTNNLYKKDEKKITFTDIEDSLILVINSFSTVTSYENQTKKSITNKFIQDAMTDYFREQLEIYFIENKMEAEKIAAQVLANKRSRETAEKTRISIRKKLTGSLDMNNRVEKFVNCRTKDINRREIYIVEGDSALGACKLGRDAEFQAIIPIRGKILNCLKADYNKIFANDIITDLLKVLGCGVEIKTKHTSDLNSFDLSQLRWNKIILCTDADVDGFQIRTLLLTMLYRLVPTLIYEKKVYIAESPLYEITNGKQTYFAYSDNEKAEILGKLKGKTKINRSKGLGENQPEMMWETTMNPETRRLVLVTPDDAKRTQEMFELLLGENLSGRKEFIAEEGYKYLELTDIS